MKIEVLDPTKLTFDEIVGMKDELYIISRKNKSLKLSLDPISGDLFNMETEEYALVRIQNEVDPDYILEQNDVPFPEVVSEREQQLWGKNKPLLTYKFNGSDQHNIISVSFRPECSGIRVSFQDKKSAETYLNYFREQFYTKASVGIRSMAVSVDICRNR